MADEASQAEDPPASPPSTQDQAEPAEQPLPTQGLVEQAEPEQAEPEPVEPEPPEQAQPTQHAERAQPTPEEQALLTQDWVPVLQKARGASPGPSQSRLVLRQRALIGIAFVAPLLVIAASIYLIVWGGQGRASSLGVISARPAPASAPTQFPGELDEDAAELAESSGDAGHTLEQPNQVVPGVSGAEGAPAGAALPSGFEDDTGDEEPTPSKPAPPKHFATVQDAAAGSCSTETVDGLSRQIIEQARCMKPNEFVPLPKRANLLMAPNVYPYLELGARDHLLKALDSKKGQTMTINSALRTVAQQYLVSHWSLSKICGVQMATRPGESNHEIGTALDIKEAGTWRPALEAQDFKWLGASDRVHFDYKSASQTRAATDVLAFQKLWNKNHKDDAITESGRFDAPTEQRLKKSPPSGFPLGASCAKPRR
ncbi:MAG TPA: M15 family metallopeptidase [Polyangiaceae bacterium]|nr:M15 family metallopeptidase [Polyangiaceae bacterium]